MSTLSLLLDFFDFGGKPAPQLTVGLPIDLSKDIPVFPPFALLLTIVASVLVGKLSGKRCAYLPAPLSALPVRLGILAIGLGVTKLLLDTAGGTLKEVGSGTMFTPVGGLATAGIYSVTRNPMYCGLLFGALPTLSMVLNSAWPLVLAPLLWAYLQYVVIASEEKLLTGAFGSAYAAYCETTPRWLI